MEQVSEKHMQHVRLTLEGLLCCAMYPSETPETRPQSGGGEILVVAEEVRLDSNFPHA